MHPVPGYRAQLIDQNGNLLMKLTADAVPNLKVWNGSAWV